MAKPTIVTRASKGSALTWTEGDTNLENLRDATIGITDGTTSGTLDLNDTLTFTAGSNVTLSYNATSKALTINAGGGSGITDVVQDTTPQLGGNLDVNGYSIVSTSNGDINLTPDGTGKVVTTKTLNAAILASTQSSGDEGGQIELALAATNNLLTGSVAIDINQSQLRIFETGGSNRGVYINLTNAATGVGTNLLAGGTPTQVDFTATPTSTDVYFTTTSAAGAGAKELYAVNNGGLKFNTGSGQITTDVNFNLNGSNLMVRAGGNVRLYDADDSNSAILSGPASLTANTLFRLPSTNGTSGDVLITDGTGVTSWGAASVASTVTLTADNTTNATNYPLFVNAATGNLSPRTDTGFTYNPSTGALTATSFIGNVNISTNTGNSADTTLYPTMVAASTTGAQALHIHSTNYQFDATNNVLSIGAAGDASASIKLLSTGTQSVSIKAPGGLSTPLTFTLPNTAGTSGQVLSTNGSGTLSWATAGGGNNIITLLSSDTLGRFTLANADNTASTSTFTLASTGGISGVSVSTNTFTLPAGTYYFYIPGWVKTSYNSTDRRCNIKLYNSTDGTNTQVWDNFLSFTGGGSTYYTWGNLTAYFTIAASKTFQIRTASIPVGTAATAPVIVNGNEATGEKFAFKIEKLA